MRALRFSGQSAWAIPALGSALAVVAATALALPWTGYDLAGNTVVLLDQTPILRLVLLLASYALVGAAAYRSTGDVTASAVAVLLGAALGWAGWEWSPLTPGWLLFALLVLLQTWPNDRSALAALGVAILWALLHPSAAWGVLLLIASAASGTIAEARRRALLLGAGLLAGMLLLARGVDLRATLLPAVRPWVWADGQARNTLADPVGLAIFALLLALLALRLLRPAHVPGGLLGLAVFGFLAWHMRRNGIWLGLAATPALAVALGGDWRATLLTGRFVRPALLVAATMVGGGLLLAASMTGPAVIGGIPLPEAALRALPATGLIVYRPEFEPALLHARSRPMLALARPAGSTTHSSWERIAANCDPAGELNKLQAEAVVLDPMVDVEVIAALQAAGWREGASAAPAVVLLQPEASR